MPQNKKAPTILQMKINRLLRNYLTQHDGMEGVLRELEDHLEQDPLNQKIVTHSLETESELKVAMMRAAEEIPSLRQALITRMLQTPDTAFTQSLLDWTLKNPTFQQMLMIQILENPSAMNTVIQSLAENETFRSKVIGKLIDLDFLQKKFYSLLREDEEQLRRLLIFVDKVPELRQSLQDMMARRGMFSIKIRDVLQWLKTDEDHLLPLLNALNKAGQHQGSLHSFILSQKPLAALFVEWLGLNQQHVKKFVQAVQLDPELHRTLFLALGNVPEFREEYLHSLWGSGNGLMDFLQFMAQEDEMRGEFIRQVNRDEQFRSVLRVMGEREVMNRLPYPLPTVTLSFPRSGSNFFQSVLQGSSGLTCISLYQSQYPNSLVYNLKSHALTPEALRREFSDMVPYELDYPQKIILIQRDPRDVMISLYEYACANHDRQFSQAEFLDLNYYFAANQPGKRGVKNVLYLPGPESCTVIEAFRLFTAAHGLGQVSPDVCQISYEGMVEDPRQEFQKAFDFLGLDCDLDIVFMEEKVSQYSENQRQRGSAYGWKTPEVQEQYAVLLANVNQWLAEEIQMLGYMAV